MPGTCWRSPDCPAAPNGLTRWKSGSPSMADQPRRRSSGNAGTDGRCRVRQAWPADAAAVALLERRCFSDPWSVESFRDALAGGGGAFGLVAEGAGEIVGYLVGRQMVAVGEVLNLAVEPAWRGQGVAGELLAAGLAELTRRGAEEIFLEVRESNEAALRLYRAAGFAEVGRRADYYRSPREAALVLRRALPAARKG